jgi:hypothetical protein
MTRIDMLTATDRETLRTLGYALTTVKGLAETLGIQHSAAAQRLERLRLCGLVTRYEQAGTRAALYEVHGPAGRTAAMASAMAGAGLPAPEVAAFIQISAGHLCVACGIEHGNCCGLCPQWVPLPGEGSR